MSRRKWIGLLFFVFGGGFTYFFFTGTPADRSTESWFIPIIFVGMALCGLAFLFERSDSPQKK
jgi:membrane-bound acyltransferase YfiQ involved in biofilm formation